METKENDIVNITIRIPERTYNILVAYKNQFKPHMSLNALIVESIIEQLRLKTAVEEASHE